MKKLLLGGANNELFMQRISSLQHFSSEQPSSRTNTYVNIVVPVVDIEQTFTSTYLGIYGDQPDSKFNDEEPLSIIQGVEVVE